MKIGSTRAQSCAITRSLTCSGSCACTATTSENSGVITDGPGSYANFMSCTYLFTSNAIVSIQFTSFAIESVYDWVNIDICTTAACTSTSRLLRASGSTSLASVYSTIPSYPFVRVQFTSDDSIVGVGWSANWAVTGTPPCGVVCLSGQYMSSNSCLNCLALSSSPAGSTAVTACVCNAGSNGPDGGTCTQCLGGTYKSGTGNSGCVDCPANSLSPAGSTAITACCNAGSNGPNGGQCYEQCVAGKYLSGTCTPCEAGKFKNAPGYIYIYEAGLNSKGILDLKGIHIYTYTNFIYMYRYIYKYMYVHIWGGCEFDRYTF